MGTVYIHTFEERCQSVTVFGVLSGICSVCLGPGSQRGPDVRARIEI